MQRWRYISLWVALSTRTVSVKMSHFVISGASGGAPNRLEIRDFVANEKYFSLYVQGLRAFFPNNVPFVMLSEVILQRPCRKKTRTTFRPTFLSERFTVCHIGRGMVLLAAV